MQLMKKALILGGGFAGIQAAIELQKSRKFEVTLISDREFLYVYPVSIWIPVHLYDYEDVKIPLSEIRKKFPFKIIIDVVREIHAKENIVVCENHTFNYDYLVVAFGSEKMKHPGQENTLSICGRPEVSLQIREAMDKLIEKGHGRIAIGFGGNPKDQSAVRGGPAFELMFNIRNLLREKKMRDKFELTFFAPMAEPGAKMGKRALNMTGKLFRKYGIGQRYGKKILEFKPDGVIFEDGTVLTSDLILFIPASSGNKILSSSDLPLSDSGFIKIDNTNRVQGFSNVYAAGDIAAAEGPEWIAKQGHIAEMMGRNSAYNIIHFEKGSEKRKTYSDSISIICLMDTGNGAAFVFRNNKRSFVIPMPVFGHWIKKGWGLYNRLVKTGKIPRIPGV